jgi:FkbM family methyltransferase
MIHKDSQFIVGSKFSTYYHNEDYSKPIDLIIDKNNNVVVNSSYWNWDTGVITDNKIQFKNHLGFGTIFKNNYIKFNEQNMWHKDFRKNILFIGANDMCEIHDYVNEYNNGLFIEAIPSVYEKLKVNLINAKKLYNTNYVPINKLVTSENDKEYTFNVFNNSGASSSIYEPNIDTWQWDSIRVEEQIKLISTTIQDVLKEYNWENIKYDLVIDVQGAELEVLKGFTYFDNINSLRIEISTEEFYKGGILFNELNYYLVSNKFIPVNKPSLNHCDVIYIRNS